MSFYCYTLCCSCGVTAHYTIKNYELKLHHKGITVQHFPCVLLQSCLVWQPVSSTPESLANVESVVCKICFFIHFISVCMYIQQKLHLLLSLFLCITFSVFLRTLHYGWAFPFNCSSLMILLMILVII